jgi:hypothetical protein
MPELNLQVGVTITFLGKIRSIFANFEVFLQILQYSIVKCGSERNLSLRGAIHTKIRNIMKVSTASQLTYIKHNTIIQNPQLFKKPLETSSSLESEAMDAIEADENVMDEIEVDENGNLFDLDF